MNSSRTTYVAKFKSVASEIPFCVCSPFYGDIGSSEYVALILG
jgi:hypothetical protein